MTPAERAEKIRLALRKTENSFPMTEEAFDALIVAEIRAAVEEAEIKKQIMHGMMVQAFDQRDEAKAEAYEDAAKIADSMGCDATFPNGDSCTCSIDIENAIRARAAEVGK